ncbi:hypothetical protein CHLRE_01g024050v5 [Chlamydomonas reinhardtii]|uniref:Regulator of microtubule dynamics protein 1 n=1 Tax=Chlamydomonas reinhardtii TaxID=3055 RepID=A8HQ12_CHLRE|nr:uncharacterized protein CHLRE_01g024050v5 [Chlamydomonas reinhardtii]PNW88317.1 hypothetical protein CHLRE_01g024050v5 [Chlamydomonas reinhardtii]|eukprot:XP_001689535.1 predicted protein [Chlamydomonas reinhardtii]
MLAADATFVVAARRNQHLPRQIQSFLHHLPSAPGEAVSVLLWAPGGLLFRAHQAIKAQIERSSHWRPFRRLRNAAAGVGQDDANRVGSCGPRAARVAARWAEQGMLAERQLLLEDAISYYEKAAAAEPGVAEYWARMSKACSDSSYVAGTPPDKAVALQRRAIELGLKAVEADPSSGFGWVACCVSRGRLALFVDNRTKVALARQAQDDVRKALHLEPHNDVAHHLLGRWNYEMASVNAVVRTIIHMLYGQALMAGSYKEAANCYQRAVALRPDYLIHRVELGRTYVKLGQPQEAAKELETALELDVPDINALLQKADAVALLAKLKSSK